MSPAISRRAFSILQWWESFSALRDPRFFFQIFFQKRVNWFTDWKIKVLSNTPQFVIYAKSSNVTRMIFLTSELTLKKCFPKFLIEMLVFFLPLPLFFYFDGSPHVGEYSFKVPHYSGRPASSYHIYLRITANKNWKEDVTELAVQQSIPCVQMTFTSNLNHPLPCFFPFLFFWYGRTACERCEMIHGNPWWHIISVLI